ncbi:hypothetical protein ACLK19_27260 [Escherichia coli]
MMQPMRALATQNANRELAAVSLKFLWSNKDGIESLDSTGNNGGVVAK